MHGKAEADYKSFKREKSVPKEEKAATPLQALRVRDLWQHKLRYVLAKKAEKEAYDAAYQWICDNEVDLGETLRLFDGMTEWIEGEDDLVDIFSTLQMQKSDSSDHARRAEADEEARMQQVIKEVIGSNFSNSAAWHRRRGTMSGRRMVQRFEERLHEAGIHARIMRRRRTELGLANLDLEEKVRAHGKLEVMLEMLAKVEPRPTPRLGEPHHQLGMLLDAVMLTRRNMDHAARDLANISRHEPVD